jgi:23S rRNA pseudouridine2605 synthase
MRKDQSSQQKLPQKGYICSPILNSLKEKSAGKPGKKTGPGSTGRSAAQGKSEERKHSPSSSANNAPRSGKRPRLTPASPGAIQSRIRPENRGKESTARMEAEEKRKAGFGSGQRDFKSGTDRPPFREGFKKGPGKPFGQKPFSGERRNEGKDSEGERKPFRKGPASFGNKEKPASRPSRPAGRPPGNGDAEKKSFVKGPRLFGDREKPNARPERRDSKKISPAKSRLGTQAPEQAKEFRRHGSGPPAYDDKKLAGLAPNRGRRPIRKKTDAENSEGQLIRLNRFIAQSGLCSRREADDLISTGQITVNGKVMDQMGYLVNPGDVVKYGRRLLNKEKFVYVLLNKPKDFLTTTEDPEERKTVMALVENACKERIYPVGRLDRNTTGLLLLTNDGELSERLMHPSHNMRKIYQVDLDKPLTAADEVAVREGVVLEDGKAPVDELEVLSKERDIVGLSIHIGRNRIVRRIFESLGYKVVRLDRVMYAGLSKKDLPRGTWRYLSEKEIINLKYFS